MGHKEERDRHRQASIERRRVKPGASRVTRSRSTRGKAPADDSTGSSASLGGVDELGDAILSELRSRAKRAAALHMWPSAAFFAEKAAAVSRDSEDVLLLARIHQGAGDPARALRVVQARGLDRTHTAAQLLAAQCLLARDKPTECLELLGEELIAPESAAPPELRAALCMLRARVFMALESPTKVELWCRRALEADPHCAEALLTLTQPGLLPRDRAAAAAREVSAAAAVAATTVTPASGARVPRVAVTSTDAHEAVLPTLYRALGDASVLDSLPAPLQRSSDVAALRAACHFAAFEFSASAGMCRDLLRRDARAGRAVVLVYLAALVELRERQELFVYAHKLVERDPADAVTWMAVGYYYLASGVYDTARLYLQKATVLDPRLVEAWVAVGHAYAAKDESEHAMTAYSTAARLQPGSHMPLLFMGMQHARQSSLGLACRLFSAAADADADDPAPRHELGVLAFRAGDLSRAAEYFQDTLALWKRIGTDRRPVGRRAESEEISLVNLGHCYRRLGQFDRARNCYEEALALQPNKASTFVALALTMHCSQQYESAITMYHRALRLIPEDVICNELLEKALQDSIEFSDPLNDVEDDGIDILGSNEQV